MADVRDPSLQCLQKIGWLMVIQNSKVVHTVKIILTVYTHYQHNVLNAIKKTCCSILFSQFDIVHLVGQTEM